MSALAHPHPMPYWSPPPENQPLIYVDPAGYGAQFAFPDPHSPPFQHAHFPAPAYESREPRFYSSLHPQAPPFIPSGFNQLPPYSLEQAPTPAPMSHPPALDPVAQALRRTMPKVRTHRPAPNDRRLPAPGPEPMDPSNISDKFVLVSNIPRDASRDEISAAFQPCGQLKGIFVRLQAQLGMVALAFFDTRHAAAALAQMHENPEGYFDGVSIAARIPSYADLTQLIPDSSVVAASDSRVYITLVGQTTALGPQMQNLLATYGEIKMFRVVGMHYKLFQAEFFDVRDSVAAIHSLNNRKLHGAVAHLSTDPDSNVIPDKLADEDQLVTLLQSTDLDNTEAPEVCAYIQPPPLDSAPETPDRVRFGRRASTGSAFTSTIGGLSANQSSDNLAEQVCGVPFPSYSTDTLDTEHQPLVQQEPRRRSAAHSFDSASASSASLSLKHVYALSPDRTVSTAPSTPARLGRKLSLPPYQGPLPPPATNQWTPSPTVQQQQSTAASQEHLGELHELDGFITVRTTAPSASSVSINSRSTLGSPHMCLPASARAVLDLLREPPPERNRVDVARIEAGLDTRTTIMIKNIPNKMSTKNLIDFIDAVTPRAIDFVYLRFDFQNECNVGYAFVNFIQISDLLKFMSARLGRKWNMYASEKVLGASYANYQGKEALTEKFKNSSIMDVRPAWRPKIFYSSGEHVGLPEPFPSPSSLRRARRAPPNAQHNGNGGLYTQLHSPTKHH